MTFPRTISIPVANHLTGRNHTLVRATDLDCEPTTLAEIVAVCNEPEIYDWLFRERLGGRRYTDEAARQWLQWSAEGWTFESHFSFAVVDEGRCVAAACDIKSNDSVAEIGYWASQQHPGVMTNAVKALCALAAHAGFQGLYARTKPGNRRSQAVLERAGFLKVPGVTDGFERFDLQLLRGKRLNPAAGGD